MSAPPCIPLRRDVVYDLVARAFVALIPPTPDATGAEVSTAVFTMCAQIIELLIHVKDLNARAHNIEVARTAVAQLYSMLPAPTTVN